MKFSLKHFYLLLTLLLVGQFVLAQGNFTSSDLPIVVINTNGNIIVDEPKVDAEIGILNNQAGERNYLSDSFEYFGKIAIEIRGSSSQDLFPKKQYGFELRDELGEDMDTTLLGMPAEEDWILFAPYNDKSFMRDVLACKLGRDMDRYATRTRYCELVINDEYMGIYVLMEKIKRDKSRVDIAKLNPDENSGEDLTGGYIVKIDKTTGNGGDGWVSQYRPEPRNGNQQIYFIYEYPKETEITQEQKNYIQGYIAGFESSLKSSGFRDPVNGYRKYIDVPSFIDFMLINELTKNVDGYRLSTFMHKQKITDGGKLHMGPIWDFNLGFGNADYCTSGNPQGFVLDFNEICSGDWWLIPFWWERMDQDYRFRNEVRLRWDELRAGPFQSEVILDYIDSVASALGNEAAPRNFERWPVLGQWVWPNYYVGSTFQDEIDWLKNWVSQRLNWLDNNLPEYVEVLGIEELLDKPIAIYPNPSKEFFTVAFDQNESKLIRWDLFNSVGKCIYTFEKQFEKGSHQFTIDSKLDRGIYFLKMSGDQIESRTVKLMRN